MFKLKFTISFLALGTAIAAVFCTWIAPFNPTLEFQTTILPDSKIADGVNSPVAVVQVKNLGYSSVWYRGRNGQITTFFSALGREDKMANGYTTHDPIGRITELKPRGTAIAKIPIYDDRYKIYFELEVQDWRGRTVSRSNGQIKEVGIGTRIK